MLSGIALFVYGALIVLTTRDVIRDACGRNATLRKTALLLVASPFRLYLLFFAIWVSLGFGSLLGILRIGFQWDLLELSRRPWVQAGLQILVGTALQLAIGLSLAETSSARAFRRIPGYLRRRSFLPPLAFATAVVACLVLRDLSQHFGPLARYGWHAVVLIAATITTIAGQVYIAYWAQSARISTPMAPGH